MTHTPGPWTQLDQEHAISIVSGGIVIADVFKPDDNCVSPPMSETVDNAHLIAAAPQLLEALREVERWDSVSGVDAEWPAVMEIVRCALAHAEKGGA